MGLRLTKGLTLFSVLAAGCMCASAQQTDAQDCSVDGITVDAVSGAPIARAHIQISGASNLATVSDAGGHWSIPHTACGMFQAVAKRIGYLDAFAGRSPLGQNAFPLQLRPGAPMHDVRLKLTPQVVIHGRVSDDAGDPVANATITVFLSRVLDGRRVLQPAGGAATNDLGEYRVPGLAGGNFAVCAHASAQFLEASNANGVTVYGDSCWPGPVQEGRGPSVPVAAGGSQQVDFGLTPVPAVHVRGEVTGMPKGRTVGVTLMQSGAAPGTGNNRPGVVRPNGKFDIAGVIPGSYTLVADVFLEQGHRLSARMPVTVGSGDIDGLVVEMEPGFSVEGHIEMEEGSSSLPMKQQLSMNLRGVTGTPGSGQMVWMSPADFQFNDIAAGLYHLDVYTNPPFYVKSVTVAGRDITREDVQLSPGTGPLTVVLGDNPGSVQGQVVDEDGQAAPASVMLIGGSGRPRLIATGPAGRFNTPGIPPGDYTAYAWEDPDQVEYANPDFMRRYASSGTTVTVTAGQAATVRLTRLSVTQ